MSQNQQQQQGQSQNPQPVPYATPGTGRPMTGRQQYNTVTDTIAGPNVRLKDNLIQGIVVVICMVLGAAVAYALAAGGGGQGRDAYAVAAMGAIGGLLVGVIGSGIFLMIYRAVQHSRGKHD